MKPKTPSARVSNKFLIVWFGCGAMIKGYVARKRDDVFSSKMFCAISLLPQETHSKEKKGNTRIKSRNRQMIKPSFIIKKLQHPDEERNGSCRMDVWKEGKKRKRNKWERQREVDEKKQAPHTTHKRMKIFFLKSDPGG